MEHQLPAGLTRAIVVHGEYADLPGILRAQGEQRVDGLVADLGVSSPQLDAPERGFSFGADGPLDMRMDASRGATLAELLVSGAFERHVRRVRALYAERRDALCAALSHQLPEGARFAPPAGGNTLWLALPAEADVALVHSGCAQRGIALHSGSPFAFEGSEAAASCDRHLVVSFATLQSAALDDRALLRRIVQDHLTPRGAVILGIPNSRYRDGEVVAGARMKNFRQAELGLVVKDVAFYRKYLQQHGRRVFVTGGHTLLVTGVAGAG